ncbi:hypothetical protein DLAC_02581 [Tieghemostelium lacteum]|uniref:FHA domain-containing protein n=1 Tax=Tieghemostelium lacteum TaxID=361077 RepID=A0A152A383_TIELA|nr:hypothetical protein DLAC_02581 [Tieghemostelium lacteum]|eukprot:KYR00565.1 hypothetical protein DLAC_02581 [Tieghemostelium lacteum]
MSEIDDEIKKIRDQRKNLNFLHSNENSDDKSEYDKSITVVILREFESYHAPKYLVDTIPVNDDDKEIIKKYVAPTVASQETEYQSRWRKRDFSPPRDYDPFTGKGKDQGRSYKDIMAEQKLKREEKEIYDKIAKIQQSEREKQREIQVNVELQDQKSNNNNNDKTPEYNTTTTHSKKKFKSSSNNNSIQWFISIFKNKEKVKEYEITEEKVLTFGRDSSRNNIVLEHESCSSVHATVTLKPGSKRPYLTDLRSTNRTLLNGKEIKPYQTEDLYEGDKITFGASSREYIISHT